MGGRWRKEQTAARRAGLGAAEQRRRRRRGDEGFSTGGLSACSSSSCRLVSTLKKSTFLLLHKTNTSSMSKLKCLNLKYYVFESIQNISSESKIS